MLSQSPDPSTPRRADLDVSVDVCCETFERWLIREERAGRSLEELPHSMRRHVDQCDACRAEHAAAGGVFCVASVELRDLREESRDDCVAEFLTRRIMAEVRAEPAPIVRAHARARWRAAAAVFIAAITTVGVMTLWGPHGSAPSNGIASRDEPRAESNETSPVPAGETTIDDPTDVADQWVGMMKPLEVPLVADFIPVVESGETTFSL
ncbi:MAG: hypothetical protein AAF488_06860 [Planctomycetota bacterium]